MKAQVIHPPRDFSGHSRRVFLAGSIEMGKAIDWQTAITNELAGQSITFLNPRRPDWDSSWEQRIDNPVFNEQVNWELDGLESAEMVVFYFAPGTQSPISLMELGLVAKSGKVLVCCPEGFWRKGNVDIICHREGIPQVSSLDALARAVKLRFANME